MRPKKPISAIIASDISAIVYARQVGVEVHISTQVNITNIEAVKFYAQYADVVVLAREMNVDRVAEISKQIREQNITGPSGELVKLEMFVHGALCMAVSGKCYLSLHEMNASANRGNCMQSCRRAYIVTDKETGAELEVDNEYIMSPKDLCTIHFLNKLLDAGVSVLKIEGRARSPEYVYTLLNVTVKLLKPISSTPSLKRRLPIGMNACLLFLTGASGTAITLDNALANGAIITDQWPHSGKYMLAKG